MELEERIQSPGPKRSPAERDEARSGDGAGDKDGIKGGCRRDKYVAPRETRRGGPKIRGAPGAESVSRVKGVSKEVLR
ncbi:hypothetical protein KM043_006834 [Ampulex compressa]|nr:hypothetical protein KM043_006834 [Ampulex compressa]